MSVFEAKARRKFPLTYEFVLYPITAEAFDVDTINLLYEEIHTTEKGKPCLAYPRKYIKHNGVEIKEFENKYTGAAIIRK